MPGCESTGAVKRSYPTPKARASGHKELPHTRGQGRWLGGATPFQRAVAAWAQEGLEELLHIQGQEGWQ